jgi:hypothetical protein
MQRPLTSNTQTERTSMASAMQRIASETLKAGLPGYDLFDRIIDIFLTRERIRVIVSSPDYQEADVLWGFFKWTKGSRREILIEGGPKFCEAALKDIELHSKAVEILTKHLRPGVPWHRRLFGAGE